MRMLRFVVVVVQTKGVAPRGLDSWGRGDSQAPCRDLRHLGLEDDQGLLQVSAIS